VKIGHGPATVIEDESCEFTTAPLLTEWEGAAIRMNRKSGDLPKVKIPSWIGVMKSERNLVPILKRSLRIFCFLALIFLKYGTVEFCHCEDSDVTVEDEAISN